jgi:hypothetical protein
LFFAAGLTWLGASRMVSSAEVEQSLTDLVLTTKARIMAIVPRIAPELVGETSRIMIQAKLERACKEALSYLARQGKMDT